MSKFNQELSTGKVLVRKTWINTNNPEQLSVQFVQQLPTQTTDHVNLIAIEQGIVPRKATVIRSYNLKVAVEMFGLKPAHSYVDADEVVDASSIYGTDMAISVVENTEPNLNRKNQTAKINPSTQEVLTYGGKDIYVHEELVPASKVEYVFLTHDRNSVASAPANV